MFPSRPAIVLALAIATATSVRAVRAETLADAVAYAYETNPALQAQRAALRALDESYVQAKAGYGLNISSSATETSTNERLGGAPLYANTDSESISLSQPIYTGGRVHSQVSEAEADLLGGRETLRRGEIDLITRVVAAYVGVLRDQTLLKVSQDTVAVLEKQLADTQARAAPKVRELTETDVAESTARLSQARADLANAIGALAVSRAQYVAVVGQAPGDLAPPPPLENLPPTIDDAFNAAENNNPQLLAAIYAEAKSRARIDEAKAATHPSVTAQVNVYRSPYIPYAGSPYNDAITASVSISQPIFTSGQLQSQIRQAADQNDTDRLSIDDARQQVILSVSTAWEQLAAARLQISSLSQVVSADEYSFYGNREESKLALRSTIDVLNAQLELTQAQQALVRARAAEYAGRVALLGAMGVLTPTMLSPSVKTYDTGANLRRVEHIGETPLEWPARALDAIGQPKVTRPPPSSIAEALPGGSPMPLAPAPAKPLTSILSTLQTPPPPPQPTAAGSGTSENH
jgi:TolC family type I secretion outer membrane protein